MSEDGSMTMAKSPVDRIGGSVVLAREGVGGCALLLGALAGRGLPGTVVHDEPAAMVCLAELSRGGVGRRVLIVVEPTRWSRLDQLLCAVDDYHGSTHCWSFDHAEGADPMLSRIPRDAYPFRQRGGGNAASGDEPAGRIRKRSRPVDRLLVSLPVEPASSREVVTQQELTMLLGPVPGEAS